MKLSEPNEVAFETDSNETLDFQEAQEARSKAFWDEVEGDLEVVIATSGKKPKAVEDHAFIKKIFLDFLRKYSDALLQGKLFDLPSGLDDESRWELIKFVVAFDTSFEYSPEDETDDEEDCGGPESDYLDDETTFRYDVIKECDRIALAGAILSKRIGSDTYALWRAAMIKLGSVSGMVQHKAVDDIVTALEETWADLRTWIFLNPPHNKQKRKSKKRKSKK